MRAPRPRDSTIRRLTSKSTIETELSPAVAIGQRSAFDADG
jgi:hypothetical protein